MKSYDSIDIGIARWLRSFCDIISITAFQRLYVPSITSLEGRGDWDSRFAHSISIEIHAAGRLI